MKKRPSFAPQMLRGVVPRVLLGATAAAVLAVAASTWQKDDPTQWTSEDVYQLLNNSPWSRAVRIAFARTAGYGSGQSPSNGGNGGVWGEGMPSGGGMGRGGGGWGGGGGGGGWGGGGMGGGRRGGGGSPQAQQESNVTVQWASALPVRLAEQKMSGGNTADAAAIKPLSDYVIAVIGLPKSGFVSQSSRSGQDDDSDDTRFADHLKVISVLSYGHEHLNPTKVELNQGRDGRTVFYFEKSEPITLQDKDVEFRITSDRAELKKKFSLKEMEYQGKLEL